MPSRELRAVELKKSDCSAESSTRRGDTALRSVVRVANAPTFACTAFAVNTTSERSSSAVPAILTTFAVPTRAPASLKDGGISAGMTSCASVTSKSSAGAESFVSPVSRAPTSIRPSAAISTTLPLVQLPSGVLAPLVSEGFISGSTPIAHLLTPSSPSPPPVTRPTAAQPFSEDEDDVVSLSGYQTDFDAPHRSTLQPHRSVMRPPIPILAGASSRPRRLSRCPSPLDSRPLWLNRRPSPSDSRRRHHHNRPKRPRHSSRHHAYCLSTLPVILINVVGFVRVVYDQ